MTRGEKTKGGNGQGGKGRGELTGGGGNVRGGSSLFPVSSNVYTTNLP